MERNVKRDSDHYLLSSMLCQVRKLSDPPSVLLEVFGLEQKDPPRALWSPIGRFHWLFDPFPPQRPVKSM